MANLRLLKVSEQQLKQALKELNAKLPLMKSQEKLNGALASFYQDLGFKANAEEDRIRFDLSQEMNWDDFERTMREIHAILGDVASFIPFANPRPSNSGKPREKHETKSSDGRSKHTYYDYYD